MTPRAIVGAGLSGLIAAHAWPQLPVLERDTEPRAQHKALLRFRSDAVARLVGIEFRKVLVRKGIWVRHQYVQPDILVANQYSRKVLDRIAGDRSVWNIEPVERYIAPDDFYEQLIATLGTRIQWGTDGFTTSSGFPTAIINTAPLPVVLKRIGVAKLAGIDFHHKEIRVERWHVPNCEVYQTVYFPTPETNVYRASITGNTLIVEARGELVEESYLPLERALGIRIGDCEPLSRVAQRFGKIDPLPDDVRKRILLELTVQHKIYSLGRFATWRNILLDDVVDDIAVLKRLMKGDDYDVRRTLAMSA